MVELDEQQVEEITVLIKAKGAEMEELTNDLIDHTCCMVEERMSDNVSYAKALKEVMDVFGRNGIRDIQDETTYLLTKNILAMKKTTHVFGITAAILLVLGSLFKIYHLPGAGLMYVVGGFLLSFIFLPLLLTIKLKQKLNKAAALLNITGVVAGFILTNAIFFKIMHWPYANLLLWLGSLMVLFVFIPLYIYNYIRNKERRSNTIVTSVILVAGLSLLFALVKLRNSGVVTNAILNIQYTLNNQIQETNKINSVLYEDLKDDTLVNQQQLQNINQLAKSINNLTNKLIYAITKSNHQEFNDEQLATILKSKYQEISNDKGNLDWIRGKDKEVSIESMITLINKYEEQASRVFKFKNIVINKPNFDLYTNPNHNLFPLGIVIHDLTLLNAQLQQKHTLILNTFKTKVD